MSTAGAFGCAAAATRFGVAMYSKRRIWTVGGGKGGTGKSFITSSLGLLLAREGFDINLVDSDLGAANLHTWLGMRGPSATLEDFIDRRAHNLNEVLTDTRFRGVKLCPASNRPSSSQRLGYAQKRRLMRHLCSLEGRTIVDIGGGSHLDQLDFFRISDLGIVVVSPDPVSVENAYQFLGSVVLRMLRARLGSQLFRRSLEQQDRQDVASGALALKVIERLCSGDGPPQAEVLELLGGLRLALVVNKAKGKSSEVLGQAMEMILRQHLKVDIRFAGAIPFDPEIEEALLEFKPFVNSRPASATVESLREVTGRLIRLSSSRSSHSTDEAGTPDGAVVGLGVSPDVSPAGIRQAYQRTLAAYGPGSLAAYSLVPEETCKRIVARAEAEYRRLAGKNSAVSSLPVAKARSAIPGMGGRDLVDELVSFASYLKSVRVSKAYSLEDVSEQTKINPRYLADLENGHVDQLPQGRYPVLMLKAYAKALGVDAEGVGRPPASSESRV